jgi:hypothetical protein
MEKNYELEEEAILNYRKAEKAVDSLRSDLYDLSNNIARAIVRRNDKALNYDLGFVLNAIEQSLADVRDLLKA